MGSSISNIYDYYEQYEGLCEMVNEIPVGVRSDFYKHEDELMKKYGYKRNGSWYTKKDTEENNNIQIKTQ